MIKFFFQYLLPLAIVAVIGVLTYNYFYGTPEEKEQSQRIFDKFKDLGNEVVGLIKSEKEKYDEGKYDEALKKIGERIEDLKELAKRATKDGQRILDEIRKLEQTKESIENQIASEQNAGATGNKNQFRSNFSAQGVAPSIDKQDIGAQIEALAKETQQLSEKVQ